MKDFYEQWVAGTIRPANGWACWNRGETWLRVTKGLHIPRGTRIETGRCRHETLHATTVATPTRAMVGHA